MSEALELEFAQGWMLRAISTDDQASEYLYDSVQDVSRRIVDLASDPDVVDIQCERCIHTITITRKSPVAGDGSVLAVLHKTLQVDRAELAAAR